MLLLVRLHIFQFYIYIYSQLLFKFKKLLAYMERKMHYIWLKVMVLQNQGLLWQFRINVFEIRWSRFLHKVNCSHIQGVSVSVYIERRGSNAFFHIYLEVVAWATTFVFVHSYVDDHTVIILSKHEMAKRMLKYERNVIVMDLVWGQIKMWPFSVATVFTIELVNRRHSALNVAPSWEHGC